MEFLYLLSDSLAQSHFLVLPNVSFSHVILPLRTELHEEVVEFFPDEIGQPFMTLICHQMPAFT